MNIQWLKIIFAAFFEVFWVIGLKHADSMIEWTGTAISIYISFYMLIAAGKHLPVGTIYAVFVGLGTAGTVLTDIFIFNEPFSIAKLVLLSLLLAGVIGLKLVTKDEGTEGAKS